VRFFVEIAALLAVIGIPAAVVAIVLRPGRGRQLTGRARRNALARARWRAHSEVLSGRTVVSVTKTIRGGGADESLGEMVIAEIPATDPEWDIKVSQAMLDARVRADILNQETDRQR
jgi:hypothetical protein